MHFARTNSNPDRGQVGNFATGLTKTSELVYYFEDINKQDSAQEIINSFLFPNVAHAEPNWYSASGVYGNFSTNNETVSYTHLTLPTICSV